MLSVRVWVHRAAGVLRGGPEKEMSPSVASQKLYSYYINYISMNKYVSAWVRACMPECVRACARLCWSVGVEQQVRGKLVKGMSPSIASQNNYAHINKLVYYSVNKCVRVWVRACVRALVLMGRCMYAEQQVRDKLVLPSQKIICIEKKKERKDNIYKAHSPRSIISW